MLIQFFKYISVGLINTSITFIMILICIYLGAGDFLSNFIGYILGIAYSFMLNSQWTFGKNKLSYNLLRNFLTVIIVSYCINLLILVICRDFLLIDRIYCHLIGLCFYVALSFLGMRAFVFPKNKTS